MTSKYFETKPNNRSDVVSIVESDDEISVIEGKEVKTESKTESKTQPKTRLKSEVKTEKSDHKVIEICESPEIIRKRNELKCISTDSPICLPKNKRIYNVSDDEEDGSKRLKTDSKDMSAMKAFEDMCEQSIKELQDLFPEVDVCEIQDALIECDWSVFNASIKIGNLCDTECTDNQPKTNGTSGSNAVKVESKICTNNEKMKSLDFYRKWKPNQNSADDCLIEDELMATSSAHNFNSIKNNSIRNRFSKMTKTGYIDVDESDDSGGEEYDKSDERVICGSSSDEEDSDSQRGFKDKGSKQLGFRTQEIKEKVAQFLQNSNPFELQIIPGVSQKKIEIIINLRPFVDWNDVSFKFNASNLNIEILDNCAEVLKARTVVQRLMNSCEEISQNLTETVERLRGVDQPKLLNPDMKLSHYQMIGLNWLALMYKKGINCILADEMGLGKTIQVIAFLAYLRETRGVFGPHLVIVPASTLDNWSREFQTWCPDIQILLYYGSQEERALIREQISRKEIKFNVIITTYTIAQSPGDKGLFKKSKFKYVVFDEAHFLKNMKSSRFTALMNMNAKHRLLLTGTPLQNNLVELMSLLIFTLPQLFRGKIDQIKTLFSYNNKDSIHRISYINDRILQAKKIMKPFVLRRLKSEVLQELPLKIDHICISPMTEIQEQKYMELIENYTREIKYKKITFEDSEPEEKYQRGTGMLMNLRKVANHPLLIRQYYDDKKLRVMSQLMIREPTHQLADPQLIFEDMQVMHDFELHNLCKRYGSINSFKLNDDLILDSGKFQELDSLLNKYQLEGKRVLLFSQFTMMLDIIEDYMNLRFYKYLRLDGTTKVGDRIDLIDQYNNDPELFVFLLSTRAGGLGINLTAASVVIIHDIDFNPYNDKQAEDRCHRIGQTKEVIVYRLISQNSVEEGMLKIGEEKLRLGRDISTDDTDNDQKDERIAKSDVKTLLRAALKL